MPTALIKLSHTRAQPDWRHGRAWLSAALLVVALLCGRAVPAASGQELHAAGTAERQWVVHVVAEDGVTTSWIHLRADAQSKWAPLARAAGEVRNIAAIGPELGLVMNSGDWRIYWDRDWRYGTALPDRGDMLALASRGEQVIAIIRRGERPTTATAATAPATAPTTGPATAPAVTSATTAPSTQPADVSPPPRTAVFSLAGGRWTQLAPLPQGVEAEPSTDLSLAIADNRPVLAVRQAGRIDVWSLVEGGWLRIGSLPSGDVHRFAAISGSVPRLWTAGERGAGRILAFEPAGVRRIALEAPEDDTPVRTIATLGDALHLVYLRDGVPVLQPYDDEGRLAGPAQVLTAPHPQYDPRIGQWLEGVLIAAMLFVLLTTLRQRQSEPSAPGALKGLRLARLPIRVMAGVVDLWPMWIAAIVLGRWSMGAETSVERVMEARVQFLLLGTSVLYVAHTLIAELLTGRSLGKMIFGLRVTNLEGASPTRGAVAVRNLLRILDVYTFPLSLLLALFTPLHQRIGDLAARTIVVEKLPPGQKAEEAEEEEGW